MSLMDEFKKIIHPYDDEDEYEEDFVEPKSRESAPAYFDDRLVLTSAWVPRTVQLLLMNYF